jgi:Ca2+-binding EF-hand superfamily protein
VEINENMVIEALNSSAVRRRDVETYLMMHKMQNKPRRTEALPIPDKFKKVDINNDGYISYDEVVKTVNDYLSGNEDFSPDDIRELQTFFFEQ